MVGHGVMTAAEFLLAAALLIVGLGMPALAWVWWVRPLRTLTPAPPVLSNAEWQAVLAAVSPPLVHAPGGSRSTLCGTAPDGVGDLVMVDDGLTEVDCAVCVDLLAVGSES